MLAKCLCLIVALISYILAWKPPTSSQPSLKTVRSMDDFFNKRYGTTIIQNSLAVIEVGIYILVVFRGHDERLQSLEIWHVICMLLSFLGMAFRRWAFSTLDRFFTYWLTILPDHQLVGTGPYKYILHPSYSGLALANFSFYLLVWANGLADILIDALEYAVDHLEDESRVFLHECLGVNLGVWFVILLTLICMRDLMKRIKLEEKFLADHFGAIPADEGNSDNSALVIESLQVGSIPISIPYKGGEQAAQGNVCTPEETAEAAVYRSTSDSDDGDVLSQKTDSPSAVSHN
ncbi:hypothetical protein BGX27_009256 [Mortierella sp. AM989]|nr:hypothetical protein BGX27_009256 [Mortierella sp. AM989]